MATTTPPKYPSQEDLVSAEDLLTWIDEVYLRSDPAAFEGASETFASIATLISRQLDVDRNGVFCIGSGAVGLSTNPKKVKSGRLKAFDDSSDIDIAVVSSYHFEQAWRDMLREVQPHLEQWPPLLVKNLNWQKKRLFDGAILSHVLLPVLSFGGNWQGALQRVAERVVIALDRNVEVNLWIYRDYWSLRNYISQGISRCLQRVSIN